MGMRSDSPRVAAANEARRTSLLNTAAKRDSTDHVQYNPTNTNKMAGIKTELYDSPTLLPRKSFVPSTMKIGRVLYMFHKQGCVREKRDFINFSFPFVFFCSNQL